MTALNDAERTSPFRTPTVAPVIGMRRPLPAPLRAGGGEGAPYPAWLPSRRFIAAVAAIGGMQLLATMDSTVAIVALPKIQNELGLSDAGRSWVITAYVLTFGGLMLLGGRLGDTIGRKRTFIVGVALFTIASVLCGIAWDEATLVIARLLQGVGAAIAAPTGLALVATTFPKGPARNAATAVFAAMTGIGSVMGLVVGGALTEVSWRLAFLVNVPIGLLMIYLARDTLRETHRERMKLDAAGALLATVACTAAVFGFTQGPEKGWLSPTTLGSGLAAAAGLRRVRRRGADRHQPGRPVRAVPRPQPAGHLRRHIPGRRGDVHPDRADRPVRAGHHGLQRAARRGRLHPVRDRPGHRAGRLVAIGELFPPRVLVIAGGVLVLGAMIYGSTLNADIPYFPNLVFPSPSAASASA